MQLRVVTDQPWDVAADVLVIPIVGEPAFEGPLDELDQRAGGELRALAEFGELKAKRYATSLALGRRPAAGRLLTVGAGDADASSIARPSSASPRPPSDAWAVATVHRLAIWLTPLADAAGSMATTRRGRAGRPRRRRRLVRPEGDLPRRRSRPRRRSSTS